MKRIRTDVWQTSDGLLHLTREAALKAEKTLRLAGALASCLDGQPELLERCVAALLAHKEFQIVLTQETSP